MSKFWAQQWNLLKLKKWNHFNAFQYANCELWIEASGLANDDILEGEHIGFFRHYDLRGKNATMWCMFVL
jgi:hypothetical protein